MNQSMPVNNETSSPPLAAVRLSMRNVGKRFGGVRALTDVSFDVRSGQVHAICGENGAGKSTLMKILSGAITDYEGDLFLNGTKASYRGPRDAEQAGIAIIYQELNLVPQLSAAANIFLGREHLIGGLFLNDATMEREAEQLFHRLGATFKPRTPVGSLRIGDQQLVEIAKALSLDADVLIMDEPTSALADGEVARLYEIIATLKASGVTIIYISHKMDEVFTLADTITILRDGHHILTKPRSEMSPSDVINQMVGRDIARLHLDHDAAVGEPVLSLRGLSLAKKRGDYGLQLKDINLDVRAGEIVGVAGLLGAGRTELLESIFGASSLRPTGQMAIAGRAGIPRSPAEAVAAGVAMVTEDRKTLGLFDQLSVGANISVCTLDRVSWMSLVNRRKERSAVAEEITRLGIKTDGPGAAVTSLSGGNQQKCILGRWLLTEPKLLLLDEPTRGIDVGAKAEIYALLRTLCRDGLAILMTSSELPELLTVCDRIVVLCEGRITAELTRQEATEAKILEAAMRFESKIAS